MIFIVISNTIICFIIIYVIAQSYDRTNKKILLICQNYKLYSKE